MMVTFSSINNVEGFIFSLFLGHKKNWRVICQEIEIFLLPFSQEQFSGKRNEKYFIITLNFPRKISSFLFAVAVGS